MEPRQPVSIAGEELGEDRDERRWRVALRPGGPDGAAGRDFPPMEKTWARISLGRMEDMEKAVPVFKKVLGKA